jgi:hypothetical protein
VVSNHELGRIACSLDLASLFMFASWLYYLPAGVNTWDAISSYELSTCPFLVYCLHLERSHGVTSLQWRNRCLLFITPILISLIAALDTRS